MTIYLTGFCQSNILSKIAKTESLFLFFNFYFKKRLTEQSYNLELKEAIIQQV